MSRTTVVLDEKLQAKAKDLDLNISQICREALAKAIEVKGRELDFNGEFETVDASREIGDFLEEVQFLGRTVAGPGHGLDLGSFYFFVTPGRRIVVTSEDMIIIHVADDVSDLNLDDEDDGAIRQALEEALGHLPTPTFLDL